MTGLGRALFERFRDRIEAKDVRQFGGAIRECARHRRASLLAVTPDIGTQH